MNDAAKVDIAACRSALEAIDQQILTLFVQRFTISKQVAACKQARDEQVYVPAVQERKLLAAQGLIDELYTQAAKKNSHLTGANWTETESELQAVETILPPADEKTVSATYALLQTQAQCLQHFLMTLSCLEQVQDKASVEAINNCLTEIEAALAGKKAVLFD